MLRIVWRFFPQLSRVLQFVRFSALVSLFPQFSPKTAFEATKEKWGLSLFEVSSANPLVVLVSVLLAFRELELAR